MSAIETAAARPALRWHGGKWRLAPWVLAHMPAHRIYVEPFGGAASVLIRKPRSYAEIYNDLDGEVVNFFRVLRDPASAARLIEVLRLTPFAREEFFDAYAETENPVERARRLAVRSYMGFGSDAPNREIRTGFRANANRNGTTPAQDWMNYPDKVVAIVARMAGVQIEQRPAMDVCRQHDGPETLHYLDPPYLPETRSQKSRRSGLGYHAYAHELTVEQHAEILAEIQHFKGMVMLSGYQSPLYTAALQAWTRYETEHMADGARPRRECLWLNQACVDALGHGPLFAVAP